jgi:hypothetical protein
MAGDMPENPSVPPITVSNSSNSDGLAYRSRDEDSRRLAFYQHRGLFTEGDPAIAYKRASSAAEWIAALELVHDCYVDCGYIRPLRSGVRARTYDLCRETGMYVAVRAGRVVGVLSTVVDSPDLLLPSDRIFPDELAYLRDAGAIIGELSSLAILPDLRNTAVFTELTRCNAAHGLYAHCTDLVCAVSQPQQSFFELLGFILLGSKRSCSDEVEDHVVLMHLDDIQARWHEDAPRARKVDGFFADFFLGENRFVPKIDGWNDEVEAMFDDSEELVDLVSACEDLIARLEPHERAALRRRLGRAFIEITESPASARPEIEAFDLQPRTTLVYFEEQIAEAS